jgi:2-polyprenyl-6-methoxyphenol hydroxylase-like FAD-dependent oxidoreductase
MASTPVLIVGAGPTGLVLALRLARHGVPFRIIEKSAGPGQASRAIAVQARTLEFYQQLGLAQEVVDLGIKLEAAHLREGGREFVTLAFGNLGDGLSPFPFALSFAQDEHERFLVRKLEAAGVSIEWGVALRKFEDADDHVRVVLEKDGAEEICEASYLCGCDGAHSSVRQCLGLDFPGGTYAQLFYVADVRIAEGFKRDIVGNLGAGGLALMFPVRTTGMQRLIGTVPEPLSDHPDLTFEELRPHVEPLLGVTVAQVNWFAIYHVHHRVAARFRVGRVFIAGDAGHIHSPAGGQGMNTGIGDAVNLSWKLADVIRSRAHPSLLDTYESERIVFARRLVASTDTAFKGMVGQGWGGRLLRTWLVPRLMPTLTRLPMIRRLIFKTISQIRISYRDSALSEGKAGRIHGGDRLPWVPDGGGNFAPLASLDWQIHIYGKAGQPLRDAATESTLPVHEFAWTEAARRAGLRQNAAYLVRPDGHVAAAFPDQDPDRLTRYTAERALRLA